MKSFHEMHKHFKASCDFLCVYTAEAHAQDEWPISSGRYHDNIPVNFINQPKTTEERLQVAESFLQRYPDFTLPMVIDPVGEPFDQVYCAWPIRFYVLQSDAKAGGAPKLVYKAQPSDCSYDIGHLWTYLQRQTCPSDKAKSDIPRQPLPPVQPIKACQDQCPA